MTKRVRAWKDESYRSELSAEERAMLPENPAGVVELTDEAIDDLVAGVEETDSCCWSSCNAPVEQQEN